MTVSTASTSIRNQEPFAVCNISGTVDGVMMIYGNGVTIEGQLPSTSPPCRRRRWADGKTHNDGVQIQAGSGIVIRRNNIIRARQIARSSSPQDAGTGGSHH